MNKKNFTIEGNIVDVVNQKIFMGKIHITEGKISEIEITDKSYSTYILPGFVDSHIHKV